MPRRAQSLKRVWSIGTVVLLILQIIMFVTAILLADRLHLLQLPSAYILNVSVDCVCLALAPFVFFSCRQSKNFDDANVRFMLMFFAISLYIYLDAVCWLVNNHPALRILNIVFNTFFYIGSILVAWMFWFFLCAWTGIRSAANRWVMVIINVMAAAGILLILGNLYYGYYFTVTAEGVYSRSAGYPISFISPTAILLICVIATLRQKSSFWDKAVLISYPVLPFVGSAVTIRATGPVPAHILVFLSAFFVYSNLYTRREQELALRQTELTQKNAELMVSQMQPHFVSNTLGMIRSLYRKSPETAEQAMNTFIRYLQKNFSDLNSTAPIPAERELEHARQFTDLELLRWPDMTVLYDIQTTNFELPAMTIQPLVENAIRHGLMPLQTGGTLTISTFETAEAWCVRVSDDGVGFDVANPTPHYEDHRRHIGLSNIKERVAAISGGTVQVESCIGKGTAVTVVIPKGESL